MTSNRTYSDDEYADALEGKKLLSIADLLAKVKPLDYDTVGISTPNLSRAEWVAKVQKFGQEIAATQAVIQRGEHVIRPNNVLAAVYLDGKPYP